MGDSDGRWLSITSWVDQRLKEPVQRVGSGRHAPRMYKMVPLLAATFIFAIVAVYSLFIGLARLKGFHISWWYPRTGALESADLFDLTRDAATFTALLGGIFAVVYAYRKQRVEEAAGHRADAEGLAKRYQDAAHQLGHEKAAVRLAGVYAMARLADDWEDERQTCTNVLCAYLRMPDPKFVGLGEAQVRRTIMRLIADHVRADTREVSWSGLTFDFSNADLVDVALQDPRFERRVDFSGAKFSGQNRIARMNAFQSVDFSNCRIDGDLYMPQFSLSGDGEHYANFTNIEVVPAARLNISFKFIASAAGTGISFRWLTVRGRVNITVRRSDRPQGRINLNRLSVVGGGSVMIRGGRTEAERQGEGLDSEDTGAYPDIKAINWWQEESGAISVDERVIPTIKFTRRTPKHLTEPHNFAPDMESDADDDLADEA